MVGDSPSAAEVIHYPSVHRLRRAASKPRAERVGLSIEPLQDAYPATAGWLSRLAELPGVDETYPPHWRN